MHSNNEEPGESRNVAVDAPSQPEREKYGGLEPPPMPPVMNLYDN